MERIIHFLTQDERSKFDKMREPDGKPFYVSLADIQGYEASIAAFREPNEITRVFVKLNAKEGFKYKWHHNQEYIVMNSQDSEVILGEHLFVLPNGSRLILELKYD
ncbi:hypothetical protein ACFVS2_26600 [Brevibacillus sp. NPDC058079]|uniref:hypothetical protein n=1 Tax=Brevibacillus sp. NPDC058079 TaxID=3346330 RepID=UPI0036E602C8